MDVQPPGHLKEVPVDGLELCRACIPLNEARSLQQIDGRGDLKTSIF